MRDAEAAFVIEGAKLLGEALDAGAPVESVYWAPGAPTALLERALAAGARAFELTPEVLGRVSDTVTPQPVLAVVTMARPSLEALRGGELMLVCAGVRDPGNAGSVLRTARAAGAAGVAFCASSVDPHNPKTVRASAGALLHLTVAEADTLAEVMEAAGRWGMQRMAAVARGGQDYAAVDLTGPLALVVGNEASGLSPDELGLMDRLVTIPMAAGTESLNVGVATAVICFEAARQRRLAVAG